MGGSLQPIVSLFKGIFLILELFLTNIVVTFSQPTVVLDGEEWLQNKTGIIMNISNRLKEVLNTLNVTSMISDLKTDLHGKATFFLNETTTMYGQSFDFAYETYPFPDWLKDDYKSYLITFVLVTLVIISLYVSYKILKTLGKIMVPIFILALFYKIGVLTYIGLVIYPLGNDLLLYVREGLQYVLGLFPYVFTTSLDVLPNVGVNLYSFTATSFSYVLWVIKFPLSIMYSFPATLFSYVSWVITYPLSMVYSSVVGIMSLFGTGFHVILNMFYQVVTYTITFMGIGLSTIGELYLSIIFIINDSMSIIPCIVCILSLHIGAYIFLKDRFSPQPKFSRAARNMLIKRTMENTRKYYRNLSIRKKKKCSTKIKTSN